VSDPRSGWQRKVAALGRELRAHPIAYSVLGCFMVGGPLLAKLIFPAAPLGALVLGGIFLGAYAAVCAVPGEFLD
jgi:hypothetical protein